MSITDDTTAESAGDGVDSAAASEAAPRRGITFEVIAILAFVLALAAALLAVFSLALSARATEEVRNAPAGGGGSAGVAVSLSEFAISPGPLAASSGSSLAITNAGSVAHDLNVEGLATPEIPAGGSADLDISSLAPGTYEVYCNIAGHRGSGMETEITIE